MLGLVRKLFDVRNNEREAQARDQSARLRQIRRDEPSNTNAEEVGALVRHIRTSKSHTALIRQEVISGQERERHIANMAGLEVATVYQPGGGRHGLIEATNFSIWLNNDNSVYG